MPKIARIASIIAFVFAGLVALSALVGPVVAAPFALVPLLSGIGIVRWRVWSAYGFALYELGQFLLVPMVALRSGGGTQMTGTAVSAIVSGTLVVVFLLAGKSLAARGAQRGSPWLWIVLTGVFTLPIVFVQPFVQPTGSMEDTLLIGDRFLVQRVPRPPLERSEIIAFVYPVDRRQTYIKRIVGVPGDRLRIANKMVYLNGAALQEPYARHKTEYEDLFRDNFPSQPNVHLPQPGMNMLAEHVVNGEVVVPTGKYFVLGDNRDVSLDSRYWGFVDAGDLIGKPILIYDSEEQAPEDVTKNKFTFPRRVRWGRLFKLL